MPDTITIIDDRTGKQVTVPITDNVFPATAVRELDPSLFIYDPAFMQTAACQSAITYLDGEAGILRYRGLSDRAAGRAQHLSRGRLPAAERRAAERRSADASGRTTSPVTPSSTRTCASGSSMGSTTTPTRWACWSARSPRSARSTTTPSSSTTRAAATSRSCG